MFVLIIGAVTSAEGEEWTFEKPSGQSSFTLSYRNVGFVSSPATETTDLGKAPVALLKGPSKKGKYRLLVELEQEDKKQLKVLWLGGSNATAFCESLNVLFKKHA